MNKYISLFLSTCFLFLLYQSGYACSCIPPQSPKQELDKSDAVFSGKVIEIKKHKQADNPFLSVEAIIEVEKSWKGTGKKQVSVFTSSSSASCGYNFQKGQSYLVYANSDTSERLVTGLCTRTTNLKDAREDLKELGKGKEINPEMPDKNPAGKSEKGFITVDKGVRLFYEKIGTGEQTLVIPLHLYLFDDFKHLANNRTLIFYDVRNRGASDRVADESKITIQEDIEDLEKLRRHFGLKKMSLIGESYVGLMVVMYAMKYPQHVENLIQIGAVPLKFGTQYPKELTANDPTPVPDPAENAKIEELRKQGYHKTNPKDFCEKDWVLSQQMLVGNPANASKVKSVCHLPNEWAESLERHFSTHFVSVQKLDIPKSEAAKVTVPVLTIHGTKDRNAPFGAGKEWSEILPNSTLLTVPGAAHFPWIDAPELVFPAIEDFLSGKPVQKSGSPKEVSFKSKDGITLYADIYESAKGKSAPLILLFHQGGGDARGEYSPIIPKILELGYNVMAADTRQGGSKFGTNRTINDLGNKEFTYCDAYQDLESALQYAKSHGFTGPRIVWGSSFSATLVLRLGADHGKDLAGVLAFSPASGPPMGECQPTDYSANVKIPALLLRPQSEMQSERSQNQFALFKQQGHQTYIAENGVHGSSMLVDARIEGTAENHWKTVLDFIRETLAK